MQNAAKQNEQPTRKCTVKNCWCTADRYNNFNNAELLGKASTLRNDNFIVDSRLSNLEDKSTQTDSKTDK